METVRSGWGTGTGSAWGRGSLGESLTTAPKHLLADHYAILYVMNLLKKPHKYFEKYMQCILASLELTLQYIPKSITNYFRVVVEFPVGNSFNSFQTI